MNSRPFHRPKLNKTKELKRPNFYTQALLNDFAPYALDEESVIPHKGQWRTLMGLKPEASIDLEIGLGNGLHFAHRAQHFPQRGLIGLELKYKPLIQSIRRARQWGGEHVRALRYHAFNIDLCFDAGEIDDVFVYFPDPWTSPRKPDNRILNPRMIAILHEKQRPDGSLYFKTDSQEAFEWCLAQLEQSPYQLLYVTRDLHHSPHAKDNFVTQFESLFLRQGLPIFALKALKNASSSEVQRS